MPRRSLAEVASALEAATLLVGARLTLAVVPFRKVSRVAGEPSAPGVAPADAHLDDHVRAVRHRCRWAVRVASAKLPGETTCIPQAVVGQMMLRRRGLPGTVVFGLKRDGDGWGNHAWLETDGVPVLGTTPGVEYTRTVEYRRAPKRAREQADAS